MSEPLGRQQFLNLAALVEGGLAVVALGLGWVAGVDPLAMIHPEWSALGWSLLATLPIFGLFCLSMFRPVGGLRTIRGFLLEHLGPLLAMCRWHDLLAVALIAGIGEELLFRGVIQPWVERSFGFTAGLIASSLAFGVGHAITPTYALLAFVMGLFFGVMPLASDPPNLLIPILTHGLYDWLAFLVVADVWRREAAGRSDGKST